MESAAGIANFTDVNGMDAVHYTFSEAAASGMTVVRMFGHGINSTLALQTAPGTPSSYCSFACQLSGTSCATWQPITR